MMCGVSIILRFYHFWALSCSGSGGVGGGVGVGGTEGGESLGNAHSSRRYLKRWTYTVMK
jgi:hypothetical protein